MSLSFQEHVERAGEIAQRLRAKFATAQNIDFDALNRRVITKPADPNYAAYQIVRDELASVKKAPVVPPVTVPAAPLEAVYARPTKDAAQARAAMAQACGSYLAGVLRYYADWRRTGVEAPHYFGSPPYHSPLYGLLHCDVGLGKTYEARKMVGEFIREAKVRGYPHRVLWLVPHHNLSNETLADHIAAGLSVAVWRGREAGDPDGTPLANGHFSQMCSDNQSIKAARIVSADVDRAVCGALTGKHCPFLATCSYKAQRNVCARADVVIAAHNCLFTPLSEKIMEDVGLVLVDEGFWSKGIHGDRMIAVESLLGDLAGAPVRVRKAVDRTQTATLADLTKRLMAVVDNMGAGSFLTAKMLEGAGLTVDDAAAATKLEWARSVEVLMEPGMAYDDRLAARDAATVNGTLSRRAAVWNVARELLNGKDVEGRIQKVTHQPKDGSGTVQQIVLRSRHDVADRVMKLPVLLLDATASIKIIKEFFPKVEMIVPRVRAKTPHMEIRQITSMADGSGGFGKANMATTSSKSVDENNRINNRMAKLRSYVRLHGGRTSLVITNIDLEKNFQDIPGCDVVHFNNLTGLDQFGNVDSIFVIGRPAARDWDTRRMALAIFGRRVPEQASATVPAGVALVSGEVAQIQRRIYQNDDLECVRQAVTDAEIIQAIGRGRGVNRTAVNPLCVHLFCDVVVPFTVEEVTHMARVRPNDIDEMWLRGAVMASPSDAAKMYRDLFKSEGAAKMCRSRNKVPESLIGKCYRVVRYQPPGERIKPRTAYVPEDGAEALCERLLAIYPDLVMCEADHTVTNPYKYIYREMLPCASYLAPTSDLPSISDSVPNSDLACTSDLSLVPSEEELIWLPAMPPDPPVMQIIRPTPKPSELMDKIMQRGASAQPPPIRAGST